jgi:hypothetical protein
MHAGVVVKFVVKGFFIAQPESNVASTNMQTLFMANLAKAEPLAAPRKVSPVRDG